MAENKNKREIVFNKYNGKCSYCGCDISFKNFHIDHIDPLRRSKSPYKERELRTGLNDASNFNPSCPQCNLSKSCMDLNIWRKELSLKIDRLHRDSSTFRMLKKYGMVKIIKKDVVFYFETL